MNKIAFWHKYLQAIGYSRASRCLPLVLISCLVASIELLTIALIFPVIQSFLDPQAFLTSPLARGLHTILPAGDAVSLTLFLVCLLVGAVFVRAMMSYAGNRWIYFRISQDESSFAVQQYLSCLRRDYRYFIETPSSKTIRDIAVSIPLGFSTVIQAWLIIISETLLFMGLAIILLALNPPVFLSILVIMFFTAIVYIRLIGPRIARLGHLRHDLSHKTIGTISQSIDGILQIKNFQSEKFFARLFGEARHQQATTTAQLMTFQNVPRVFFESILMMIVCVALAYSIIVDIPIQNTLPLVGFYVVAGFRVLPSVLRLSAQYNVIKASEPAIRNLMDMAPSPVDSAEFSSSPVAFHKSFDLRDIHFSYGADPVLKDVFLTLKKGEMVGIHGKSGAGKTTLINVLTGLLKPDKGQIVIDDIVIPEIDRTALLPLIGYISQNVFILNASLRQNIALGVPEEDIDEDRIRRAIEDSQLNDFVNVEPEGVNTILGERGNRLSGGQKQRVGIARALYFNRDILIMDEPTSALDPMTERNFCESLSMLKSHKAILIISHRPEPLALCDHVYDMSQGQLEKIR
jgi:ABC-type bacteriocin/lantibiotic exporter with double-glycine peptidase domain